MLISASSFATFEANVKAWIVAEEAKIKPLAEKFVSEVVSNVEIAFEDLAQIAGSAVLSAATKIATGQEKFGVAVTDVIQTVEASGKTVATLTAQTAVQQAFGSIAAAVSTLTGK
jgi:lipopolysaccharide biosynthesis regulator YciM